MSDDATWSAVPPPPGPPPPSEPESGYLSEQSKRKFTITAGVLGAVFFLAQMILPGLVSMVAAPAAMAGGFLSMSLADVSSATFQDGRVWYLGRSGPFSRAPRTGAAKLMSFSPGSRAQPEEAASLSMDEPSLLAGEDRLWVISPEAVGFYKDGNLTVVQSAQRLGDLSRPFLYGGRPAVIEQRPSGCALQVHEAGQWRKTASFTLAGLESTASAADLQVLADGTTLHLFLKAPLGNTLYYRQGLPADDDGWESWTPIASTEREWSAIALNGQPAVFLSDSSGPETQIVGMKPSEDEWEEFYRSSVSFVTGLGVCPAGGTEDFILLLQSFPGSIRVIEVQAGQQASKVRYGGGFPFPRAFVAMIFLTQMGTVLLPVLLAFILAALMRTHRVCQYVSGTSAAAFAPLSRRAVAQLVDSAILAGPMVVASYELFSGFQEMDGPFGMVGGLAWVAAGLFWALLAFLAYSVLEGRWGRTPGKWITGIQVVGTDLQPCGFGRALVRNLLKLVDGFFNFLVGILLVALTNNWQRLGDMAARTVVIRSPRRQEPFPVM